MLFLVEVLLFPVRDRIGSDEFDACCICAT